MKIHFGDEVLVTGGFYEGSFGSVWQTRFMPFVGNQYYLVPSSKNGHHGSFEWIHEKNLTLRIKE